MFYRIKDGKLYDFADYKYVDDCKEIEGYTMEQIQSDPDLVVVSGDKLIANPDYAEILQAKNKAQFESEFFETSLGWIRRKVSMKDGTVKDFLGDLLLPIKAGLEMGQEVEIITYNTPDFEEEYTTDYIISLQEKKSATADFVKECLAQVVKDFGG